MPASVLSLTFVCMKISIHGKNSGEDGEGMSANIVMDRLPNRSQDCVRQSTSMIAVKQQSIQKAQAVFSCTASLIGFN